MSNEFSHLHVHSDYSLLDGLGKIGDYVKYGKSLGMKAMAFTDHVFCNTPLSLTSMHPDL